jgi:hypothetical protein
MRVRRSVRRTGPSIAVMTRFEIGSAVSCSDGPCGKLVSLVVNPLTRAVAHLVVEPEHRWGLGRLIPIDLASEAADGVALACTLAEFEAFDMAEEAQFLNAPGSDWGVDGPVMLWPYYALDHGDTTLLRDFGGNVSELVNTDVLPAGEVAVKRGDRVHALDGEIGLVQGLIVDPRDGRISYALVEEGHLLGRKEVAIPIASIESVDNGIQVSITKEEIRNLPSVDTLPSP